MGKPPPDEEMNDPTQPDDANDALLPMQPNQIQKSWSRWGALSLVFLGVTWHDFFGFELQAENRGDMFLFKKGLLDDR